MPIVKLSAVLSIALAEWDFEAFTLAITLFTNFLGNPSDMQQGCHTRFGKAYIQGDPHSFTFDNAEFDYHGTCPVVLSKNCVPGNLAPFEDFRVLGVNNDHWTGKYEP